MQAAAAADVNPTTITAVMHTPPAASAVVVPHPAVLHAAASSVDLDSTDLSDAGVCDGEAVEAVRRVYRYCKRHGVAARVAVAGVRTLTEARAVAGADGVAVSPRIFRQLVSCPGPLQRELEPLAAYELCTDEVRARCVLCALMVMSDMCMRSRACSGCRVLSRYIMPPAPPNL